MIHHAWSVLCDKVIVDQSTNNLSIDVVEQLSGTARVPDLGEPQPVGVFLPTSLKLVSLWYRTGDEPETGRAELAMKGPSGDELATHPVDLELTLPRSRTIITMAGVPYVGRGVYSFVVRLQTEAGPQEVAAVPLYLDVEVVRFPVAPGAAAPTAPSAK